MTTAAAPRFDRIEHRRADAVTAYAYPLLGPVVASRQTETPWELDARSPIVRALARSGTTGLTSADRHERVRWPRQATMGAAYARLNILDASEVITLARGPS